MANRNIISSTKKYNLILDSKITNFEFSLLILRLSENTFHHLPDRFSYNIGTVSQMVIRIQFKVFFVFAIPLILFWYSQSNEEWKLICYTSTQLMIPINIFPYTFIFYRDNQAELRRYLEPEPSIFAWASREKIKPTFAQNWIMVQPTKIGINGSRKNIFLLICFYMSHL